MGAVNDFLIFLAEGFTGLFNAAGDQFASFITGMIPMLICLILTIKAVIQLIGEERVYGFMKRCTKYAVLRYTLIPFLCTFFLCNPMHTPLVCLSRRTTSPHSTMRSCP